MKTEIFERSEEMDQVLWYYCLIVLAPKHCGDAAVSLVKPPV